jgi:hypothetical protein
MRFELIHYLLSISLNVYSIIIRRVLKSEQRPGGGRVLNVTDSQTKYLYSPSYAWRPIDPSTTNSIIKNQEEEASSSRSTCPRSFYPFF